MLVHLFYLFYCVAIQDDSIKLLPHYICLDVLLPWRIIAIDTWLVAYCLVCFMSRSAIHSLKIVSLLRTVARSLCLKNFS